MYALLMIFFRRNNPPPSAWVGVAVVVFIAAVFVLAVMAEKMRRQRLIEAAGALGFFPEQPEALPRTPSGLFDSENPVVEFAMSGSSSGLECHLFDFGYGRPKQRRRQTIALYRGSVRMPQFRLAPVNLATKMMARLMPQVQAQAVSEQLGSRYFAWSNDPESKQVVTPEMIGYLEQFPPSDLWIDAIEDSLFIYYPSRTINAAELSTFLDASGTLATAVFSQLRSKAF